MPRCPICARAPSTQACSCCFEARFFPQALWLILSVTGSAPALVRHAASRFNSVSRHVGTCCNPFAQRGVSRSPWLPALRRVSQTAAQHHGKERRTASREQDGRWKRELIERHLRDCLSSNGARRLTVTPRHAVRRACEICRLHVQLCNAEPDAVGRCESFAEAVDLKGSPRFKIQFRAPNAC